MHTIIHLVFGIIFVLLFGLTFLPGVVFILASVLMDLDHVTEINLPHNKKFKEKYFLDISKYKEFNYQSPQKSMHLLHTFEFILLLFLSSLFYYPLFWVATAFAIHLGLDALGNIWNRNLGNAGGKDWIKYWFLVYYIRKHSIYNKENFSQKLELGALSTAPTIRLT